MTRDEAAAFIAAYFENFAAVARYLEQIRNFVRTWGYVETLFGRRRYIPDVQAANPAIRNAAARMATTMPIPRTRAARDLRAELVGRSVAEVALGHPGVVRHPAPEQFAAGLVGATVTAVERRGKYILCPLDSGDDLVIHLGMTGHLEVVAPGQAARPHTHMRAALDDGRELRYADARRFGRLLLGHRDALTAAGVLPRLGLEPIDPEFTAE